MEKYDPWPEPGPQNQGSENSERKTPNDRGFLKITRRSICSDPPLRPS